MRLPSPTVQPGLFWGACAGIAALCVLVLVMLFGGGSTDDSSGSQRISFQIATGSTSGTYFPVGEAVAGLLSHPPGIGRCEAANVCGPPGLIVNARATAGSIANLRDVDSGRAQSGLAQADVVAEAVTGKGAFAKTGRMRQIRLIAELYPEAVHIIASRKAGILTLSDLRGKRVSLSTEGSGTVVTARAVLAAYGLSERRIVPSYESTDRAAELMQEGKLDAFFFVGGTPARLVQDLLEQNVAAIVPIDGKGRDRLLTSQPTLSPYVMPLGTYSGSPAVETVSVGALWVTNAQEPDDLIYAMVKALYNPANRDAIDATHPTGRWMTLNIATKDPVAPFHPGAARYFREAGILAPKDSER